MPKLVSIYKSATTLPWSCGFMAACYVIPMDKSLGINDLYGKIFNFIEAKGSDWHFFEEDYQRIAPKVLKKLLRNPKLINYCQKNYLKNVKAVLKLLDSKKVLPNLQNMDDKQIATLLKEAINRYFWAGYYVEPPDFSLELGGQQMVKEMLKKHLDDKGFELKASESDSLFGLLATFTKVSFSQRAEASLLKICLLPENKKQRAIKKHVKEFYWQFYDYYGPILTENKVEEELKAYQSLTRQEASKRLKQISNSAKNNVREQKEAIAKYKLTKEMRTAFKVIRDFGYLYSDLKKEMTTRANIAIAQVLHFAAGRHGLDSFLLHFATVNEVIDMLTNGTAIDSTLLKSRSQSCLLQCLPPEKGYFKFLEGDEENKVRQSVSKLNTDISQLKGMPACSGKYRGKVRVVKNTSQIDKFEQGEVLVAPYTVVNYLPAMKKAGAIVTDLGGITCHAAIVSRELGIPCVIDTKVATQILKDGQIVEVNANHGLINIISGT